MYTYIHTYIPLGGRAGSLPLRSRADLTGVRMEKDIVQFIITTIMSIIIITSIFVIITIIIIIIIIISSSSRWTPPRSELSTTPGLHNKIPAHKIFTRGWVAQKPIFS